jgi:hypothetical protein
MGKLHYGDDGLVLDFDDRTLIHLEIVIRSKLRAKQPFCLNWTDWESIVEGPSMLWLCDEVPVTFTYDSDQPPAVNPEWIAAMYATASESGGLLLRREPRAMGHGFWPTAWTHQY